MTRTGSLKRLGLFGVWTLAGVGLFYVPTLTGGSPWSWHVADLDVRVLMGLSALGGALWAHWWWPQTTRWPELEREIAEWLASGWRTMGDARFERLQSLVRPHVLKREGR